LPNKGREKGKPLPLPEVDKVRMVKKRHNTTAIRRGRFFLLLVPPSLRKVMWGLDPADAAVGEACIS
jgi:hypothetical protein